MMTNTHPQPHLAPTPVRGTCRARWSVWLCWLLLFSLAVPGCGGCGAKPAPNPKTAKKKPSKKRSKKDEKPKPDFEVKRFSTRPGSSRRLDVAIKPGHWTSTVMVARANNFNFRGQLDVAMVSNSSQLLPLDDMPFHLRFARPATLPKGQLRNLEFPIFAPVAVPNSRARSVLETASGGTVHEDLTILLRMPAHQYFFVILAKDAGRYQFISSLDSIRAPTGQLTEPSMEAHYRLIAPKIRREVPLPSQPLAWSSLAYVLWDDIAPDLLDVDQQTSLVDWLHWGGQILISGPDTLDKLRGSFLDPYLPVEGAEVWELTQESLAALDSAPWTRDGKALRLTRPWSGQKLKLRAEDTASLISSPDGQPLLVERRVGRGRVVVSAFRLSERDLRDWPCFDGFFNALLLRRPSRMFGGGGTSPASVKWLNSSQLWDPALVTKVRYFSRDERLPKGFPDEYYAERPAYEIKSQAELFGVNPQTGMAYLETDGPPIGPGVAGWNDFSGTSTLARRAVKQAAGIKVPSAQFVFQFLAIYIAILVPLNWTIFKLLGRVEWAWIAAPFIAVGGAATVLWLAQVNIGFARSRTELAILEVQADYPRAHLTRYTALYSSLGTSYDLRYNDPTTLAMPSPTGKERSRAETYRTVTLNRTREVEAQQDSKQDNVIQVSLNGFDVNSNTTELVHTEQMFDLGGAVRLKRLGTDRFQVTNGTKVTMRGVAVITSQGATWIGTLEKGATKVFTPNAETIKKISLQWEKSPETQREPEPGAMNVRPLITLGSQELAPGAMRLVAWTAEEFAGLSIRPDAAQARQLGFIVVHLRHADLGAPQPDNNLRPLVDDLEDFFEDEGEPGATALPLQ